MDANILDKILRIIPQYLTNIFELISSPRQFPLAMVMNNRIPKIKNPFNEALKFLGISCALLIVLAMLRTNGENIQKISIELIVTISILTILLGLAIFLSWKIFGTKKDFTVYLIVVIYHVSVIFIVMEFFWLISDGYLKLTDKELFDMLQQVDRGTLKFNENWSNSVNYQTKQWIINIGLIITTAWYVCGYDVYRIINNTKIWKSYIVLILTIILMWISLMIFLLITKGLGINIDLL